MGCDGGTIPRRDELVRMKKKPEQKDKDAERSFKWRNCALTQQRLQEPVVACGLGRLYSKSSVIEALLDKETKPEIIAHIKNLKLVQEIQQLVDVYEHFRKGSWRAKVLRPVLLYLSAFEEHVGGSFLSHHACSAQWAVCHTNGVKDIKDLKLAKNPAYKDTEHTEGSTSDSAPYICPISGIEMTGKFRFVFLWSCGCVLAERALKEVRQNLCHMCQAPFTDNDVIVLNGTEEDIKKLHEKMAIRVASRKSSKKSKAEKTGKVEIKDEPATPSTSMATPSTSSDTKEAETKEVKEEPQPGSSNAVKKEVETIPLCLPKYNPNKITRGHFGSTKRAPTELVQDPQYKKTKKDYSVAEDPQSSEVYKSLFTSHQSEQDQKRAHWVTYNPFYN